MNDEDCEIAESDVDVGEFMDSNDRDVEIQTSSDSEYEESTKVPLAKKKKTKSKMAVDSYTRGDKWLRIKELPQNTNAENLARVWKYWIKTFMNACAIKRLNEPAMMKAQLLLHGGALVMKIEDSKALEDPDKPFFGNEFEILKEKCDITFKQHIDLDCELMKLRGMKQKSDEIFSLWVNRLEQQADNCDLNSEAMDKEIYMLLLHNSKQAEKLSELKDSLPTWQKVAKKGRELEQIQSRFKKESDETDKVKEESQEIEKETILEMKFNGNMRGTKRPWSSTSRFNSNFNSWPQSPSTSQGGPSKLKNFRQDYEQCSRCGRRHGPNPQECGARNEYCRKCNRIGHFARCCRSRIMNPGTDRMENSRTAYSGNRQRPEQFRNINKVITKWDEEYE